MEIPKEEVLTQLGLRCSYIVTLGFVLVAGLGLSQCHGGLPKIERMVGKDNPFTPQSPKLQTLKPKIVQYPLVSSHLLVRRLTYITTILKSSTSRLTLSNYPDPYPHNQTLKP